MYLLLVSVQWYFGPGPDLKIFCFLLSCKNITKMFVYKLIHICIVQVCKCSYCWLQILNNTIECLSMNYRFNMVASVLFDEHKQPSEILWNHFNSPRWNSKNIRFTRLFIHAFLTSIFFLNHQRSWQTTVILSVDMIHRRLYTCQ